MSLSAAIKLWAKQAKVEGFNLGYIKGYVDGYKKAYKMAYSEGFQDAEYEAEVMKGEYRLFRHILIFRFGLLSEDVLKKIENATSQQLDDWTSRLIKFDTLEEVLADEIPILVTEHSDSLK